MVSISLPWHGISSVQCALPFVRMVAEGRWPCVNGMILFVVNSSKGSGFQHYELSINHAAQESRWTIVFGSSCLSIHENHDCSTIARVICTANNYVLGVL